MKKDFDLSMFEKIPSSALDNNEVTEEEILKTSENGTAPNWNNEDIEPDEEDFNDKGNTTEGIEEDNLNKANELISGEFVTDLMDSLLPAIIVTSIHFIGYQVEKKELFLTAKDKKAVSKAMDRALAAIKIDFKNPFVNLSFVLTVIYGAKIIELIPNMKKIDKKKKVIEEMDNKELEELAKPTDEQLFEEDFNKLADKVIESGRRKTRAAAKKMLIKENPDSVNVLRTKHGLPDLEENLEEDFSL
jgi:hypothetical protein